MMKKLIFAVGIGFLLFGLAAPSFAAATSVDALIEKLVDKGVITKEEAREVKVDIIEDEKLLRDEGLKQGLPSWVKNINLKGDLRLRYQYKHEKAADDYAKDTQVGRVRMRLGLDGKVNEKLFAGIGIATNSAGDPRSTNLTFGDSGYSTKMEIRLDNAYAKYSALPWLNLVGGKMLLNDVLWEPTDLIWDTDITPEGGVIQLQKNLGPNTNVFMNSGVLIQTADTSSDSDPVMMYLIQPGVSYKFNDVFSLKGAFTANLSGNTKGRAYPTASWYKSSNTKEGANWKYDYQTISPALEFSVQEPFKAVGLNVEKLKLFGEYVNNLAVSDKNTGFAMGFQLGNDKISKFGDWQFRYIYAMLEKDAVLDTTPDSDRYSGKTGMRSHEGILNYGLSKNTFLGIDVYRSWNIIGTSTQAPETLVQVDWNMKF